MLPDELLDFEYDELFSLFPDDSLPEYVSLVETNISGAAGFVLIFEKDTLFTQEDLLSIEQAVKAVYP